MSNAEYQQGFSNLHPSMYDVGKRTQKADKMVAVLDDYFGGQYSSLSLLDIGCSTGIMTNHVARGFRSAVGIDIDEKAVSYAQERFGSDRVTFRTEDAMALSSDDGSFDVILCAQIYEHVPDPRALFSEMWRVLRPGGVVYLAASNRLTVVEPHYGLPFLSMLPKPLAHLYLRLARGEDRYYEKLRTYWGLRSLVRGFEVLDYTARVIAEPEKYHVTELVRPGSFKQRFSLLMLKIAYFLCPTYIWLLRKASGDGNIGAGKESTGSAPQAREDGS